MMHIKVVWKETQAYPKKPFKYRKRTIQTCGKGWVTDLEGDDNIYKSRCCAKNAIDKALGGTGRSGEAKKRKAQGIQVIGKKSDEEGALA